MLLLLVTELFASSVIGGLIAVGNKPLIGLDGHTLAPGDAAGKVLLAWICVLAPTLALAAVGLLGSVAFGRSPMGLLLPMIVGLGMQVAQMLPMPVAVRLALPGYAFISWNGLFTDPQQLDPLLIAIAVSLVWAVAATTLAYLMFARRDFTNITNDGAGRRVLTLGVAADARRVRGEHRPRRRHDRGHQFGHRPAQAPAVHRHRVRPPLSAAGAGTAPAADHRGAAADLSVLRQERRARHAGGTRQRLALHGYVARARS